MLVTITKVSQEFTKNGDEYRKVIGATAEGRETTKSIFNNLQDKWGLLIEGKTLEFTMQKSGQFWNVIGIKDVAEELPPPQEPQVLPEHQEVIDRAVTEARPPSSGKNRAFALSYAKDIAVAKIMVGKEASAVEVIDIATLFESYLEYGQIKK